MAKRGSIDLPGHIHSDIHINIFDSHIDHPGVPVQILEEKRTNTTANTIKFNNIIIRKCAQLNMINCNNQYFLNNTLLASYSISLKS